MKVDDCSNSSSLRSLSRAARFFHLWTMLVRMGRSFRVWSLLVLLCMLASAVPAPGAGNASQAAIQDTQVGPDVQQLDLADACRIALEQNPNLQAALERVVQAEQRVVQAKAAYWPIVQGTLSRARVGLSDRELTQNQATAGLFDPGAEVEDPQDQYSAGIRASFLLFNGLKRHFSALAASHNYQQNIWAQQDVERQLLFAVSQSYYNAQLAQANLRIAKADEVFQQRQLQEAEARERVGSGSLSDVLNFKVRLNAARASGIRARENYQAALAGLAALMGYERAVLPAGMRLASLAQEEPEEMQIPALDAALAYALEHRPDLKELQSRLKGSQAQVKIARADFFPEVDLQGNLSGFRPEDGFLEEKDFGHSISLNFTYTLFDGGRRRAVLRESRALQREVQQQLENLRLELASDLQQTIAALEAAREQLVLQRENVELVRSTRELVEKEYTAGVGSLVRLNESQRDVVRAESELALALVSLRQARIDFQSGTGRILEMD